jgi:hypothetical protein
MAIKPDYFTMLWEITLNSNYSDEYLLGLSEEQVQALWETTGRVKNNDQ